MKKPLLFILCILWLLPTASLATPSSLTIVYYHPTEEPFLSEIAFKVWQNSASAMGVQFNTIRADNLTQAISLLENGKAQLIVGPIIPTAQILPTQYDYVDTYIPNQTGILISTKSHLNVWKKVFYLLKIFAGVSFLTVLCLMLVFAVLVWLAETRSNSDVFPRNPISGIAVAWWFSIVSFTTVGYGDYVPKSSTGRFITVFWLFISLILGSTLYATMSSEATRLETQNHEINSLSEIGGKPIGYLQGHIGAYEDIEKYKGIPIPAVDFQQLATALTTEKISAAFVNNLVLNHELRQHPSANLKLLDLMVNSESFSFIIHRDNPLESVLIRTLYQQQLNGQTPEIISASINTSI